MPTTPLTIRPPKSCFHAYYAMDPAFHTARIIAVLIWAGSPSTTKCNQVCNIQVNLAKQYCCHTTFIQFRVIFDVLTVCIIRFQLSDCLHQFLSGFPSMTKCNQVRNFPESMSSIRSMHYLQYDRLDRSQTIFAAIYLSFDFEVLTACINSCQDSRPSRFVHPGYVVCSPW